MFSLSCMQCRQYCWWNILTSKMCSRHKTVADAHCCCLLSVSNILRKYEVFLYAACTLPYPYSSACFTVQCLSFFVFWINELDSQRPCSLHHLIYVVSVHDSSSAVSQLRFLSLQKTKHNLNIYFCEVALFSVMSLIYDLYNYTWRWHFV